MNFEARGIGKMTANGRWLFNNVNIFIKQGDIVVLSGPSGSGKTTLLKCISQLVVFDAGNFFLNGQTPEELSFPVWRSRVLYIPQRPPTLPGTPLDFYNTVLKYSAQARRKELGNPVEIAADWNFTTDLWTQDWNTLSGGEMQRAALAIGLAMNPDVLLLDEPTSALDPDTALLVEHTLKKRTCLWVTHNPEQERRVATKKLIFGNVSYGSAPDAIGFGIEEVVVNLE